MSCFNEKHRDINAVFTHTYVTDPEPTGDGFEMQVKHCFAVGGHNDIIGVKAHRTEPVLKSVVTVHKSDVEGVDQVDLKETLMQMASSRSALAHGLDKETQARIAKRRS